LKEKYRWALSVSVGAIEIGKFLSFIGFILTFTGFFIFINWGLRKSIGERLRPFIMAGAFMVVGILLMIVGYYFPLVIQPFIH
jgi:hypothetical protein